jgi:pimeloyl-ACP methyl ester carboxylesterase
MPATGNGDGAAGGHAFEARSAELHGHEMIYRIAGSGPPVVLIHGMVNSSRHWERVALGLADRYSVIAPDLLGHGDTAAVRGDYSLGAHAASIRDLMTSIGIERASIVGHSLGGGVAMIFFYQFPQRTERLALISSGGLGPQVSPMLRAAAVPGAEAVVWAAAHPRIVAGINSVGARLRERGVRKGVYFEAVARALGPLGERGARKAFLKTLRAVIDVRGQAVSARDRLHLVADFPILIAWGERDRTIPIEHGREAHEAIPGSRFATLPRAAHFPHLEDPDGLTEILHGFLTTTEPAELTDEDWGALVNRGFAGLSPVAAPTRG